MILIVCLVDNNGILFNRRRQSQDRTLRDYILKMTSHSRLWMNAYTFRQFQGLNAAQIQVAEDFPAKAGSGEYCFCEGTDFHAWEPQVEQVTLFRWNRVYPADLHLDQIFLMDGWRCTETEKFPGYSHEKITKEVYTR